MKLSHAKLQVIGYTTMSAIIGIAYVTVKALDIVAKSEDDIPPAAPAPDRPTEASA